MDIEELKGQIAGIPPGEKMLVREPPPEIEKEIRHLVQEGGTFTISKAGDDVLVIRRLQEKEKGDRHGYSRLDIYEELFFPGKDRASYEYQKAMSYAKRTGKTFTSKLGDGGLTIVRLPDGSSRGRGGGYRDALADLPLGQALTCPNNGSSSPPLYQAAWALMNTRPCLYLCQNHKEAHCVVALDMFSKDDRLIMLNSNRKRKWNAFEGLRPGAEVKTRMIDEFETDFLTGELAYREWRFRLLGQTPYGEYRLEAI